MIMRLIKMELISLQNRTIVHSAGQRWMEVLTDEIRTKPARPVAVKKEIPNTSKNDEVCYF